MVGSPWNDETQARHLAILTGVSRLTDDSEVDACATTLVNADTSSVAQALREQIGGAEVMPFVCAQAAEHADGAALQQPPAAACVTGERLGRGARVSDDAIAELAARDPCAAFDLFERQAGQTASAFLREWHYDYEEMLASTTAIHARVQYSLLPLGPVHCVTAATAHFIETLNGQPAMDVLLRDTGELMARNPMHFLLSHFQLKKKLSLLG